MGNEAKTIITFEKPNHWTSFPSLTFFILMRPLLLNIESIESLEKFFHSFKIVMANGEENLIHQNTANTSRLI